MEEPCTVPTIASVLTAGGATLLSRAYHSPNEACFDEWCLLTASSIGWPASSSVARTDDWGSSCRRRRWNFVALRVGCWSSGRSRGSTPAPGCCLWRCCRPWQQRASKLYEDPIALAGRTSRQSDRLPKLMQAKGFLERNREHRARECIRSLFDKLVLE